jgi:hypothetical protein
MATDTFSMTGIWQTTLAGQTVKLTLLQGEDNFITGTGVVFPEGNTFQIVAPSANYYPEITLYSSGETECLFKGTFINGMTVCGNGMPPLGISNRISDQICLSRSPSTTWEVFVDSSTASPSATLELSMSGAPAERVTLRGVCYSPCPINGSNAFAPAIGDWFWDTYTYISSGQQYTITGWQALWERDLPNLRALGANTIRIYSMLSRQLNTDGNFPSPWNSGTLYTHTTFLDQCWNGGTNPLYVLVGIPLPQAMFWQQIYDTTPQSEIDFWTNVLRETVEQVATHPAVLGFIIQNEWDSNVVTYGSNTKYVEFWWSQVEAMAQIVKTAAPTKLVGMADHDDPNICGQAASYMAQCPSMDFWGVNTYQTVSFSPVFGPVPHIGPGYEGLTGAALKAVILTEWGMPATSHQQADNPATIYSDTATQTNSAAILANLLPQAYGQFPNGVTSYPMGLCLGLYYFEYSDEWWNQGAPSNIYTWYGGPAAPGFPNGYWDQEGFGLYQIQRGAGLQNDSPIWCQSGGNGGPCTPIDTMIERLPTVQAVQSAFDAAE